jgi:hypothetical protein
MTEGKSNMDRRRFLQSSLAASALAGAGSATRQTSAREAGSSGPGSPAAEAASSGPASPAHEGSSTGRSGPLPGVDSNAPEYYELRLYHVRRGSKQKLIQDYHREVLIPALNRYDIGPVGVFEPYIGPESPTIYLLITYKTIESFAGLGGRLTSDNEYKKSGASFLNLPTSDPAYVRLESSLMVAFSGLPRLETPKKQPRIFELRTYESPNKKANQKKIEMFNTAEIPIFRRTGLRPVFFGETLIGPRLPNLTYMVTFADIAEREISWSKFGADPDWKKLSSSPEFGDPEMVSNISNAILRPAPHSQI